MKAALRALFPLPEWALFFEVANGTGANVRRYADAVAMNCFPSRGMEIHGIEVKSYRSDWLRELKDPAKSELVQQYCDRWWIAATAGIVKAEEVPVTWGLLELKDGKLRQVKAAPPLEAKPLSRSFVASMLRSAGKIDNAEIEARVNERTAQIQKFADERIERELKRRRDSAAEVMKRVEEIKAKTGIDLTRWDADYRASRAIKFAMSSGIADDAGGVFSLAQDMKRYSERLEDAAKAFGLVEVGE